MNKITDIPIIPEQIIKAVNNKSLAVFIGAGVSRLIGCMGWQQLAYNLVNKCFLIKKKDGSGLINFKEKEKLINNKDHKKTITICYYLLKNNGFENIFYEELENSLKTKDELNKSQNIYNLLWRFRGLFITTNIDEHFDSKFLPTRIVYKENEFNVSNIDRNKLYHIHGSIKDKESIIFTVPQYINRYNNPIFIDFLKKIFDDYIVLFIGYGMSEFELLDFLITKFDSEKGKELKHFILLPFYSGEENILKFEQYYFNSMGIYVIPYKKDERGYEQLYYVIKSWSDEINKVSIYLYDTYKKIENIVDNYSEINAEKVFQLIKNDEPQEIYFFKQLAKTSNPFPWLKPLKEKGYFDPQNNPSPEKDSESEGYIIPYWNVLDYLFNVAQKNAENPDHEITELLLEIIDKIINYRDKNGERIDNFRTDWMMLKIIFLLPIEKIKQNHIEFLKIALNSRWSTLLISSEIAKSILKRLIEKNATELILQVLDIIFKYKKTDEILREYISIMDEYWLKEALKNNKRGIAKLCGIRAVKIAINKIKSIIKEDKGQFSTIIIPTIEDHPQTRFPDKYEYQLVYFIRDIYKFSESEDIKDDIKELLNEDHPIFKRIAIQIINYHYKDLSELFWNWKDNPLNEDFLKHELYELFKNNCKFFTKDQIYRVIQWIESKNYYISDKIKNNKDKVEKILSYRKKEWLSALLNTNNRDVLSLYKEYDKINPSKLEHPGFDLWMEIKWGKEISLFDKKLLEKSNEDIIEHIKKIEKEKNIDKYDIGNSLKNLVLNNPYKITNNIKPFLNISRIYQHFLLNGFIEAFKNKKNINLKVVVEFILNLISNEEFWKEKYNEENYRNLIINSIAELIEEVIKNDNDAFNPELFNELENILLIIARKIESDVIDKEDLIISVLNSHSGKIYSAMINYSLKYAKIYNKKDDKKWKEEIKEFFNNMLNYENNISLEFSFVIGQYLVNLYWLDKNWVEKNINIIFSKNKNNNWIASFNGYLYSSSSIYKEIYFLLRENSHYTKAIKTKFDKFYINEKLVQHICIGYIYDWEKFDVSIENSLILQLLENNNPKQILEIVNFFWKLGDEKLIKLENKIKLLWEKLLDIIKENKENVEYKKIASNLLLWISLIKKIDEETFNFLKLTMEFSDKDINTTFFLEYLLNHVSVTPEKVGKIFIEMLNMDIFPYLEKDNIIKIVDILYNKNEKQIANKICNLYGMKGYYFLKELYMKYNIGNIQNN